MKKLLVLLVTIVMMTFSGIGAAAELPDGEYVEVTGVGEPGQSYSAGTRAAELVAYRKAAEEIHQFQLDSDSTVEQGLTTNDVIRTKLSAIIRRAKIVNEHKGSDGYYYATVRVPMYGAASVASAVFVKNETKITFAQPQSKVIEVSEATTKDTSDNSIIVRKGGYTGVIIDCRGLGLTKAMSPVIKAADGAPIYGYKNLDYDMVIAKGMAAYSTNMEANVDRAGSHPLIVKAIKAEGYGSPCNPVVSRIDADKILAENEATHFLNNCAVVFVR